MRDRTGDTLLLGDVFDVAFKANVRNVHLAERRLALALSRERRGLTGV